jgi:hypothetical protein
MPETGVTSCVDISAGSMQPPGREAMANEVIEGDEWEAYVALHV